MTTIVTSLNGLTSKLSDEKDPCVKLKLVKEFLLTNNEGVSIDVEYLKDNTTLNVYLVVANFKQCVLNVQIKNKNTLSCLKKFLLEVISDNKKVTIATINVDAYDIEAYLQLISH